MNYCKAPAEKSKHFKGAACGVNVGQQEGNHQRKAIKKSLIRVQGIAYCSLLSDEKKP
jgi:hypothetical protein